MLKPGISPYFAGSDIKVRQAKRELKANIRAVGKLCESPDSDIRETAQATRQDCQTMLDMLKPFHRGTLADVAVQASAKKSVAEKRSSAALNASLAALGPAFMASLMGLGAIVTLGVGAVAAVAGLSFVVASERHNARDWHLSGTGARENLPALGNILHAVHTDDAVPAGIKSPVPCSQAGDGWLLR
ncbi:MAG TPA: hypothetical protein VGO93_16435 [Candidatus Xenobia bacterium]|jgi:hypothetical protein